VLSWEGWTEHFQACRECSDWTLYQQIRARGFDPDEYACVHIANQITWRCETHADPRDCPDVLIIHNERFDEYELLGRYGDHSVTTIQYCPWCGVKLPESMREQWVERLEALGFDDPATQEIPEEYKTGAWYRKMT